eukprot:365390-Chlamydomonas_euryale.AAC.22
MARRKEGHHPGSHILDFKTGLSKLHEMASHNTQHGLAPWQTSNLCWPQCRRPGAWTAIVSGAHVLYNLRPKPTMLTSPATFQSSTPSSRAAQPLCLGVAVHFLGCIFRLTRPPFAPTARTQC